MKAIRVEKYSIFKVTFARKLYLVGNLSIKIYNSLYYFNNCRELIENSETTGTCTQLCY